MKIMDMMHDEKAEGGGDNVKLRQSTHMLPPIAKPTPKKSPNKKIKEGLDKIMNESRNHTR
jgi:hypothetical protein